MRKMLANRMSRAVIYAVLAAVFYGISAPMSKLLLEGLTPGLLAALLYLGAGLGVSLLLLTRRAASKAGSTDEPFQKSDRVYVLAMVVLDIAAPLLLMYGLRLAHPANVALLNNFEIVATTLIAMLVFREAIGKTMWLAIALLTVSSLILSIEDAGSLTFSSGSLLVLLACICWGLENNCTRVLSGKNPLKIVVIKGFGAGLGALMVAVIIGSQTGNLLAVLLALLLGFVAYGLSIALYIRAQRDLGAARTSAFYAIAPFIGAGLSFLLFQQAVSVSFMVGLGLMLLGTVLVTLDAQRSEAKL